jgi:hypothetical protein
LILGAALVINAEPMIQLVGISVLLWVPGCAYYTTRGYNPRLPHAVALDLAPVQMPDVKGDQVDAAYYGY